MMSKKSRIILFIMNILYYILFLVVYGSGIGLYLYLAKDINSQQDLSVKSQFVIIFNFFTFFMLYSIAIFKYVFKDINKRTNVTPVKVKTYQSLNAVFKKCGLSLTVIVKMELMENNYDTYEKTFKVPIYFIWKTLRKRLKNITPKDSVYLLYKMGQEEVVCDLMFYDKKFQNQIRLNKIKKFL